MGAWPELYVMAYKLVSVGMALHGIGLGAIEVWQLPSRMLYNNVLMCSNHGSNASNHGSNPINFPKRAFLYHSFPLMDA
eukprot:355057-Chlamydomonas_euryale.AAC.1